MKKSLSPGVIVLIIAVLAIVIGLVFFKGAGPGKNQASIEKQIEANRAKINGTMPTPGK